MNIMQPRLLIALVSTVHLVAVHPVAATLARVVAAEMSIRPVYPMAVLVAATAVAAAEAIHPATEAEVPSTKARLLTIQATQSSRDLATKAPR